MAGAQNRAVKQPVTQGLRTGGRSKRVVEAVLGAAIQELGRSGYEAFQIEEVARLAGVNRTSIYRRWPTKVALIEAAMREVSPFRHARPRTGLLAADLLALSRQLVRWLRSTQGRSLMTVLMREVRQPELILVARRIGDESMGPYIALIDEAKARGEIASDVDAQLLMQMILAPVTVRLERNERVDTRVLMSLIEIAVTGAAPRQPRAPLRSTRSRDR